MTTGPRVPIWTDLVMDQDSKLVIDVSRVQMLFFTLVVAVSWSCGSLTSGTIPDIPVGFQTLMGISNGVYLLSKFVQE